MAIATAEIVANGSGNDINGLKVHKATGLQGINSSKLTITRSATKKTLPADLKFEWGSFFTDHMLTISHDPATGWADPEIKPHGPLSVDPAATCFQYATNLFEGMKVYRPTPTSPPVFFRPSMNMARMRRSTDRLQLPAFDEEELMECIKRLVLLDEGLIPPSPCSLYVRPTIIGTRPTLGVAPSSHCLLYCILSPNGPFFPDLPNPDPANPYTTAFPPVSLLATTDAARSWPGGVGSFKVAGNYAPCFKPQMEAREKGFAQNLWCLQGRLAECGQMNLFVVFGKKGSDGEWDEVEVATPENDGTILPGATRDSVLSLLRSHVSPSSSKIAHPPLDIIPSHFKLTVSERPIELEELVERSNKGEVLEVFGSGTAAVICPVGRIGLQDDRPDMNMPSYPGGLGDVSRAVFEVLSKIQMGLVPGHPWTIECK